jgi:hypothetical protein
VSNYVNTVAFVWWVGYPTMVLLLDQTLRVTEPLPRIDPFA